MDTILPKLNLPKLYDAASVSTQWPDPEASIGEEHRMIGKRRTHHCWEMCGPALEQYSCLSSEISTHLREHAEVLVRAVGWSGYMVGKTCRTANPTVFFWGRNKDARKAVKHEIKDSGLLKRYPGFRTDDSSRPPHLPDIEVWSGERDEPGENAVLIDAPNGLATLGMTLNDGRRCYVTTAAHAFSPSPWSDVFGEADDESDSGYDFETSEGEVADEHNLMGGQVLLRKANNIPETGQVEASREVPSPQGSLQWPDWLVPEPFLTSTTGSKPGLDYCLIQCKPPWSGPGPSPGKPSLCQIDWAQLETPALGPGQRDILAYHGVFGRTPGTMSASPSFVAVPGGTVQELWTVSLVKPFGRGDCGCMIVDNQSRRPQGHIVAGSPDERKALLVPAAQVLKDIQGRLGRNIRIALPILGQGYSDALLKRGSTHDLDAYDLEVYDLASLAKDHTRRFRVLLSHVRCERLLQHRKGLCSGIRNIPIIPQLSHNAEETGFEMELKILAEVPKAWSEPSVWPEIVKLIPLSGLEVHARQNLDKFNAGERPVGTVINWGYRDFLAMSLMEWFQTHFFSRLDNPGCFRCGHPTIFTRVNHRGETPVELVEYFICSAPDCQQIHELPIFTDPITLMEIRRGTRVESTVCFAAFCAAMGFRIRWVWCSEIGTWLELFSDAENRWVSVDIYHDIWDQPLVYSQVHAIDDISYCIAFSDRNVTDVTRRYMRRAYIPPAEDSVSASAMMSILARTRRAMRASRALPEQNNLAVQDEQEELQLQHVVALRLVNELDQQLLQRVADLPENDPQLSRSLALSRPRLMLSTHTPTETDVSPRMMSQLTLDTYSHTSIPGSSDAGNAQPFGTLQEKRDPRSTDGEIPAQDAGDRSSDAHATPIRSQRLLGDFCRNHGWRNPVYSLVSDRRGGRTAWACIVTVESTTFHSRYWYDGVHTNAAMEDAAEKALQILHHMESLFDG